MQYIGKYYGREVFYLDRQKGYLNELPNNNWQCLLIANGEYDKDAIYTFAQKAIALDVLGIRTQGKFGSQLEMYITLLRIDMEIDENDLETDTSIGGDNEIDLANAFWECFGAQALPERTDYDNLKLVCISFDGKNYKDELKGYIDRFNSGWLPEE